MADFPRSVEEIAADYGTRRAGMLRALTVGKTFTWACGVAAVLHLYTTVWAPMPPCICMCRGRRILPCM